MNKTIWLIIFFLSAQLAFAQGMDADSLQISGEGAKTGRAALELAKQYASTDATKAMEYVHAAYKFATDLQDSSLLALTVLEEGRLNRLNYNFAPALELFSQAFSLFESAQNREGVATTGKLIADTYADLREYDHALEYYRKTYPLNEKLYDSTQMAEVLSAMAQVFETTFQYDSAKLYHQLAIDLRSRMADRLGLAFSLYSLGNVEDKDGNLKKARIYAQSAWTIFDSLNNDQGKAYCHLLFAVLLEKSNSPQSQKEHCLAGLQSAKQANVTLLQVEFAKQLSKLSSKFGDYKQAYEYSEMVRNLNKSLDEEDNSRQIQSIRFLYEIEKKDAENKSLQQTAQQRDAEFVLLQREQALDRLTRNLLLAMGLLALIAGFFLLRAYRQNKKVTGLLHEQYQSVRKQNLAVRAMSGQLNERYDELAQINEKLSELNEEKDSLMGIVAHDLKSPLNKIKGITQLLPLVGSLNDEQKDMVRMIDQVAENGRTLIRDLLDVNAIENYGSKVVAREFDINEFMHSLVLQYQKEALHKNITIHGNLINEPVPVKTDDSFVQRIMDNLVSNAIKFSQKGTSVTLTLSVSGRYILLGVRDEGPGISAEDQKKMFKKFQRLSATPTAGESSTGLGLSIIKALVERLRGTIKVESELGKGTEFIVKIPKKFSE